MHHIHIARNVTQVCQRFTALPQCMKMNYKVQS